VLLAIATPAWVTALFASSDYEITESLFIVPVVLFANICIILHLSRNDRWLRTTLLLGLTFQLAASSLYCYMSFHVFSGSDALGYWRIATRMAFDVSTRDSWHTLLQMSFGTAFICRINTLVVLVAGESLPTLVVFYALLTFWAHYLTYRSFCVAVPSGNRYLAAVVLFYMPSLVFWAGTIGKDAMIGFCIALAVYGFALLYVWLSFRGIACIVVGAVGALLVRPHVGAMLAGAIGVAYLWGRNLRRAAGTLMKMVAAPVLCAIIFYVADTMSSRLEIRDLSSSVGLMRQISKNTHAGGSAFGDLDTPVRQRLLAAPFLLFRPFPWEVHNVTAALACLESLVLAGWFWVRRHYGLASVKQWRARPLYSLIIAYSIMFTIVFAASMTNFGILVRQRVMLLPLILLLFCGTEKSSVRIPKLYRTRTRPTGSVT
jgi:hypothetical protein